MAGPAIAADSRGPSTKTCASGYHVGLYTATTSTEWHYHSHKSDTGSTYYKNSGGVRASLTSITTYRVDTWSASTPGSFSTVTASCGPNPV